MNVRPTNRKEQTTVLSAYLLCGDNVAENNKKSASDICPGYGSSFAPPLHFESHIPVSMKKKKNCRKYCKLNYETDGGLTSRYFDELVIVHVNNASKSKN